MSAYVFYIILYLSFVILIWIPLWKVWIKRLKVKNSTFPEKALKIFFHEGDKISPRDRAIGAELYILEKAIQVNGRVEKIILYERIKSVQLHQIPGIMTTIKIETEAGTYILGVVRFIFLNQLVVGNAFRNLWLFEEIKKRTESIK